MYNIGNTWRPLKLFFLIICFLLNVLMTGSTYMLSILWKWYAALPVGEEMIAAPLVAAAG